MFTDEEGNPCCSGVTIRSSGSSGTRFACNPSCAVAAVQSSKPWEYVDHALHYLDSDIKKLDNEIKKYDARILSAQSLMPPNQYNRVVSRVVANLKQKREEKIIEQRAAERAQARYRAIESRQLEGHVPLPLGQERSVRISLKPVAETSPSRRSGSSLEKETRSPRISVSLKPKAVADEDEEMDSTLDSFMTTIGRMRTAGSTRQASFPFVIRPESRRISDASDEADVSTDCKARQLAQRRASFQRRVFEATEERVNEIIGSTDESDNDEDDVTVKRSTRASSGSTKPLLTMRAARAELRRKYREHLRDAARTKDDTLFARLARKFETALLQLY